MNDRIFRLLSRRQRLDDQLRSEMSRRLPDVIRLLRLKALKARVKRTLNRVTGEVLLAAPA